MISWFTQEYTVISLSFTRLIVYCIINKELLGNSVQVSYMRMYNDHVIFLFIKNAFYSIQFHSLCTRDQLTGI